MPSKLNTFMLSAAMLAALLQCAPGAPVEDSPTDSPAGEPSGEEGETERPYDPMRAKWDWAITATETHLKELEEEFHNNVKYYFLKNFKISSLPENCPKSNFSKEACLHRLVEGLLTYTVLLQHVEKEYPNSSTHSDIKEVRGALGHLISLIKEKMRDPAQVTARTSSQEEQLLRDLDNPDTFHRKMTAFRILHELRDFLVDGQRVINKKLRPRGDVISRVMAPVTFYNQMLKR